MVVLGGLEFLMSEVPLYTTLVAYPLALDSTSSERRGNNLKVFKALHPKAKAIIWPELSYMCRIRSTADPAPSSRVSSSVLGRFHTLDPQAIFVEAAHVLPYSLDRGIQKRVARRLALHTRCRRHPTPHTSKPEGAAA